MKTDFSHGTHCVKITFLDQKFVPITKNLGQFTIFVPKLTTIFSSKMIANIWIFTNKLVKKIVIFGVFFLQFWHENSNISYMKLMYLFEFGGKNSNKWPIVDLSKSHF